MRKFWKWRFDAATAEYARLILYLAQWGPFVGPAEREYVKIQMDKLDRKIQKIYLKHGPFNEE